MSLKYINNIEYANEIEELYLNSFPKEERFEAFVTASPIQTLLFIPTSFLPALTTNSWAVETPIPTFIVEKPLSTKSLFSIFIKVLI